MKNLWLASLPYFIVYGLMLLVTILEFTTNGKQKVFCTLFCIFIIAFMFFYMDHIVLVQDLIEKDTNVIVGEYVKYGRGAVASFRVYIECDGKTYFVHAPAYARIVVDLEEGKTYEIEYFVNSRVIKEFKLIE